MAYQTSQCSIIKLDGYNCMGVNYPEMFCLPCQKASSPKGTGLFPRVFLIREDPFSEWGWHTQRLIWSKKKSSPFEKKNSGKSTDV